VLYPLSYGGPGTTRLASLSDRLCAIELPRGSKIGFRTGEGLHPWVEGSPSFSGPVLVLVRTMTE
jgi:hypothetical protein